MFTDLYCSYLQTPDIFVSLRVQLLTIYVYLVYINFMRLNTKNKFQKENVQEMNQICVKYKKTEVNLTG